MLTTPLCRQLGITYPIFSVGMGALSGPELAAAVSNAGACGVLGLSRVPAAYIHREIQRTRTLTDRPFGANIILARPSDEQVAACLEAKVPLLVFFWGDPALMSKPPTAVARRSSYRWAPSRKPARQHTWASME